MQCGLFHCTIFHLWYLLFVFLSVDFTVHIVGSGVILYIYHVFLRKQFLFVYTCITVLTIICLKDTTYTGT